ncbi:hypothetical protein DL93DRAFT_2081022 [Clavulina sp. PMI_390]|nr:hypothetical protein DL93DRAFT_2081022 [Clavulina sp. PMI_390]
MASSSSPIIPISEPPKSLSLEEHHRLIQTTPSSFEDLPPVLRSKTENVAVEFDPSEEQFTSEDLSKGTLYVTEGVLAFVSASSSKGFQVLYPSITIHAVSRSGERAMIYCQLEQASAAETADDENIDVIELKIFPSEASQIDDIFEALSYCASLHPDPNMEQEDDADEAFYNGDFEPFNGDDGEELSEVGRVRSNFVNDNRFQPY